MGYDSFEDEPPNAALSLLESSEPQEIVLVLRAPRFEGADLLYDVEVLEGSETVSGAGSSLFIDVIGRPMTAHPVARRHRRVRRRRFD